MTPGPTLASATPRRRRDVYRTGQVELDTEAAIRTFAPEGIGERLTRPDLDRPYVGCRLGNKFRRERIRKKVLHIGVPLSPGIATVLRQLVLGTVRMPMIVLQPEPHRGRRDDPCARSILTDMKGNPDLREITRPDVHDNVHVLEGGVRRNALRHATLECLTAERLEVSPEDDLRITLRIRTSVRRGFGLRIRSTAGPQRRAEDRYEQSDKTLRFGAKGGCDKQAIHVPRVSQLPALLQPRGYIAAFTPPAGQRVDRLDRQEL